MTELVVLLSAGAAVCFLLGIAVGLNIYPTPQPRRDGFEIRFTPSTGEDA